MVTAPAKIALELIHRATAGVVGGSQTRVLQTPRIHRVNDDRRAIRHINQPPEALKHAAGFSEAAGVLREKTESVREQHHRLPAGKVLHTSYDIVDRAKRPRSEKALAKIVELLANRLCCTLAGSSIVVGVRRQARLQRSERTYVSGSDRIPSHLFDRRVKLSLVGCKLLQRSNSRAGAYDRYEITFLHLLVDELLQSATDIIGALKR